MLCTFFVASDAEAVNGKCPKNRNATQGLIAKTLTFRNIFQSFATYNIKKRKPAMSNFKVVNRSITFTTNGEIDFVDLSNKIQEEVTLSGIKNGLVHVFAPHATGILILTENDAALLDDIKEWLEELVPKQKAYNHPSNAHSHLRSILLPPDKTIPIFDGKVTFGTWQSLLFVETDVYPRKRTIIIQVMGEE